MSFINLKTVYRNLLTNKLVFTLSIIGLSVGFAVFITGFMHYRFMHSYDKMHRNSKNIYRMHPIYGTSDGHIGQFATSDNGYGPTLKEELPEVVDYVRMLAYQSERIISYEPDGEAIKRFREPNVFLVDSNFFSFFDYKLKLGSAKNVLNKPNTIVISESAAKKYFGNENPIGKKLQATTNRAPYECEITGIFYDIPDNSNLQFNFLISLETIKPRFPGIDNSWNFAISYTYLHLVEDVDIKNLEDRIMKIFFKRSGFVTQGNLKIKMELAPFEEIHLDAPLQWELEKKGNRAETKYLMLIAIITIAISWLNHVNISTSLAVQRNKNMRIKSILGSGRFNIILFYFTEAFVINLLAVCISVLLILFAEPLISTFFQHKGIAFIYSDAVIICVVGGIVVLGTVLTALVSAVFFFINNPDYLINTNTKSTDLPFRRIMVITQFSVAVILIVGSITVYKQIQFLRSQELGIDLNKILVVKLPGGRDSFHQGLVKVRNLLENNPSITHVSAGSDIPGQFMDMGYLIYRTNVNPPVYQATDGGRIDYDYVKTLGLQLVAGEDFNREMNTDRKILINEEMARILQFKSAEDAVDQQVLLPEMYGDQPVTVLGVLKNYRQQSPDYKYKPVFFYCLENSFQRYNYFIIRYTGNTADVISFVNEKWEKAFPSSLFNYYFLNDHYEKQYNGNERFGKLISILSLMAILISVLGLLGLSINTTQQRIKEIGIRKVNGARVNEILALLNKDFGRWILVAIIIGCILAYWVMNSWLKSFATQTTISWWIFALTAILTMGIGLLTVSWQSWRAATQNPVEALRYE